MKKKKHDDRLKNDNSDFEEKPEVFALKAGESSSGMSRRSFIGKSIFTPLTIGTLATPFFIRCSKNKDDHSVIESVHIMTHSSEISSVAFSKDGKLLASASNDLTIKIWSLPDGQLINTLTGFSGLVLSLRNNPFGDLIAWSSTENKINIWRLPDGELIKTLSGCTEKVYSIAISSDGKILASGEGDSTIKLWNLDDGTLVNTLQVHSLYVNKIAFSPDGQILASAGGDKKINLMRFSDYFILQSIDVTTDIHSIVFSPDNQLIAAATNVIKIWSVSEGTLLKTLTPDNKWPLNIQISPDGNTLVSVGGTVDNYPNPLSFDKKIDLWSLEEEQLILRLIGHLDWVYVIAISPDGLTLASGSSDKTVRLWSLETGYPIVLPTCYCDTACTCDTIANHNPNFCNCNSIETCTCYEVCTCDSVCSCNTHSTHYWHPN